MPGVVPAAERRSYAEHFIAETRFQNVAKCVHVQAAIGIEDPVEETRWLQEQADRTGFPNGIVAHCDLGSADAKVQKAAIGHQT